MGEAKMKALYTMVGMQYRKSNRLIASLKKGTVLDLRRDPNNPVDSNAVEVWYGDRHVAFVRALEVVELAKKMDDRKLISLKGSLVFGRDDWPEVEVEL